MQQSIHNSASAKQLREGGQCRVLRFRRSGWRPELGVQVSPCRRDQRARAVRQYENEMQAALAMGPAQHFQRLPLEGMAPADDRHPFWVVVEVAVVGSVSCLP